MLKVQAVGDDATGSPRAGSWNVRITGHPFDIGDMRELLREPFQLVAIDGHDYLRIGDLDAASDEQSAMDQASAVVRRVNGALAIARDDARPITIDGGVTRLRADGRKDVHVMVTGVACQRVRVRGVGVVLGPDGATQPAPEDPASRALASAERHSNVEEALLVMASGKDDRYYRLREIVEADIQPKTIPAMMGGSVKKEYGRFKLTINDSRHHRAKGSPYRTKGSPQPMNSDEVRAFARRMFDCWLAELDRRGPRST